MWCTVILILFLVSRFLLLLFRFVHFYSGKFKTNFKRRQTRDLIVDELLLIFSLEIIVIFRSFASHSHSLSLSIESNQIEFEVVVVVTKVSRKIKRLK